jgi:hypothetical protein
MKCKTKIWTKAMTTKKESVCFTLNGASIKELSMKVKKLEINTDFTIFNFIKLY